MSVPIDTAGSVDFLPAGVLIEVAKAAARLVFAALFGRLMALLVVVIISGILFGLGVRWHFHPGLVLVLSSLLLVTYLATRLNTRVLASDVRAHA